MSTYYALLNCELDKLLSSVCMLTVYGGGTVKMLYYAHYTYFMCMLIINLLTYSLT